MNDTSSHSLTRISMGTAFSGMIWLGLTSGASGVLLPSLSAFYHVGTATLGSLFFLTSLGYCLSALSCGLLVERLGQHWLLGIGWGISVVGLLGFAMQLPFALLLAARLSIGLGAGLLDTGFNIAISRHPRSPLLLNYLHAFWGAGSLAGPLLVTGILAWHWGWNWTFIVLLVFGLPLLPTTVWLMREPTLVRRAPIPLKITTKGGDLGALLSMPIVWLVIAFLLLYVGIEQSIGDWGYSFLIGYRLQGAVFAGWAVSGYWLGMTIGRFLIQRQAERIGLSTIQLMSLCLGAMLVGLLLIWLIPLGPIEGLGFGFLGLSLAPIFPLTIVMIHRLVPAHLGASAVGLLVSASIGLAFLPWIAGILAQAYGIGILLPYLLVLALALLGLWFALTRSVRAGEIYTSSLQTVRTPEQGESSK